MYIVTDKKKTINVLKAEKLLYGDLTKIEGNEINRE